MGDMKPDADPNDSSARERLLKSAYELFSTKGIRAVGINAILTHSGVARMTLYRHFASKNELVLEFLRRREKRWAHTWLVGEVDKRATTPREKVLAIFDAFDEWFRRNDFEGCSFINVLVETTDREDPLHSACTEYLSKVRTMLQTLVAGVGVQNPVDVAHQLHILMKGSIVAAMEGDREAAKRAQQMAILLLDSVPRASDATRG